MNEVQHDVRSLVKGFRTRMREKGKRKWDVFTKSWEFPPPLTPSSSSFCCSLLPSSSLAFLLLYPIYPPRTEQKRKRNHPSRISQAPQCRARTRARRRSRRRAKTTTQSPSIRPSLLSLRPTRGEETRKRERRRRGRRNWIVSSSIAHDWSSPS